MKNENYKNSKSTQDDSSRPSQLATLAKETLYNSTAQSIFKLFDTRNSLLKLIIVLYLIMSSSLSAYLIIKSYMSFLSYEAYTTTTTAYDIPSKFPTVTICNRAQFTTEAAIEFLKKINRQILPNIDVFDENLMKNLTYTDKRKYLNQVRNAGIMEMKDVERLSHYKKDMILSCSFNGDECSLNEDITLTFDDNYGTCFVFNSGKNSTEYSVKQKYSFMKGMDYGLRLVIYVNYHEKLSHINSIGALGLKIRINNSSFITDDTSNGIRASAGEETDIKLNREFKFHIPKPYSNCDIDNESPQKFDSYLYDLILQSPYAYNQDFCFRQCRQKHVIDKCNCSLHWFSVFNSSDCLTPAETSCMNEAKGKFFSVESDFLYSCSSLCPLECNSSYISASVSTNKIIGDLYADYIRENRNLSRDFVKRPINPETARDSIIKLNIFYENLTYSLSVDTPKMDWISLFAYIGGILGLFLGISVFSFFEILILLIEIIYSKTNNNKI